MTDVIDYKTNKKQILNKSGITKPIIKTCRVINIFTCESILYQKKGINMPVEIVYRPCINYS